MRCIALQHVYVSPLRQGDQRVVSGVQHVSVCAPSDGVANAADGHMEVVVGTSVGFVYVLDSRVSTMACVAL
jgi:hypothetical protein